MVDFDRAASWISRSLIAVLFGAALLIATCAQGATYKGSQTIVPRQSDGRYDAQYLDGNDSSPLTWGACPAFSFVVGDSCAINLRTACSLTGTNAATATLAKDSGTLPAGCSAGTDGLTGTVSGALSPSAVVWRATDGTASVTAPFSIAATAAPAGDTIAPTIPTGCSGTGGTGTVTITCDQSSDPYVSEAGSGVASYKIYLTGVLVGTQAAPAANIQSQMSGVTVGSADGSQSCTRTGANLAMSGGGAGLSAAADQLYGCGYAITGDFLATAKLTGFAGAVSTGTAGLMVRASDAAGSAYGTARGRDSDDQANDRYRSSTGVNAANSAFSGVLTYPYWLRMVKTATGITASTSSDGNTFVALETERALTLGTSPYILAFHASGTAGTNTTSGLEQVNVTNTASWSHVHSTSVGGSYQVSAVDVAGNESAKGTAFSATPSGSASCTGDQSPQLLLDDTFDSSPSGTTLWVSGTSYTRGDVRKSPANSEDYYCAAENGANDCTGSTDPSASAQWEPAVDSSKWTTANCIGFDSFSPSQDACPGPSTLRARSGARSLRVQLTYHRGGTAIPALWVSGTTYAIGNEVASPANYRRYTRKTNGAGTTDPRDDPTNWERTYWYEKGDYCAGSLSTCTGSMAHRTELSMVGPTDDLDIGDDIWYGFSTFVPASGDANGDPALDLSAMQSYLYPWQLHDAPDPGEISRNPPLWLSLYGPATGEPGNIGTIDPYVSGVDPTYWRLGGWWDADAVQTNRTYDGSYGAGDALGTWKTADQGVWTDWVIHYRPHYLASQGVTEVWKNGTKVLTYLGANAPNDQTAPYLKMGIYTRNWDASDLIPRDWPKQTVYYLDEVKVARTTDTTQRSTDSNNCAYRAVAPSGTSH